MAKKYVQGRVILAGLGWQCRFVLKGARAIALDDVLIAHFRKTVDDETILSTASTANGRIARINSTTIDIAVPPEDTANWTDINRIVFDVLREIDGGEHEHMGFRVTVPVRLPVTRL